MVKETGPRDFETYPYKIPKIGPGTYICPTAVVYNAEIGDGTYIGDYTVLGAPLEETIRGTKNVMEACIIGKDCIIRQHNVILETAWIGNRVHTGPFVEIRERSVIGDDCRLHVETEVMHDAKVGCRVRTAESVMIGEYSIIDDDVALGPHVVFAPDKMMTNKCRQIVIGRGARIGAHVVVIGGVQIGIGALIGANSLVTKDIPAFTVAYGTPAKVARPLTEEEVKEYNDVLEMKWGKQKKSLLNLYEELVEEQIAWDQERGKDE